MQIVIFWYGYFVDNFKTHQFAEQSIVNEYRAAIDVKDNVLRPILISITEGAGLPYQSNKKQFLQIKDYWSTNSFWKNNYIRKYKKRIDFKQSFATGKWNAKYKN